MGMGLEEFPSLLSASRNRHSTHESTAAKNSSSHHLIFPEALKINVSASSFMTCKLLLCANGHITALQALGPLPEINTLSDQEDILTTDNVQRRLYSARKTGDVIDLRHVGKPDTVTEAVEVSCFYTLRNTSLERRASIQITNRRDPDY